jgi:hypothetical protein
MIHSTKVNVPSLIVRCAEWFENEVKGMTRIVGPVGFYQAILSPTADTRVNITADNLYHPSNFANPEDAIYLHKWIDG